MRNLIALFVISLFVILGTHAAAAETLAVVGTSNSGITRAAAPQARVVKAVNTLNGKTMIDAALAGGSRSIPIVGNDGAPRRFVSALVVGTGLEPIDFHRRESD